MADSKVTYHDRSELPEGVQIPDQHLAAADIDNEVGENHRLNTVDDIHYAVKNKKVIGHLGRDDEGSVKASYVDPEHRRQGVSEGLYKHVAKTTGFVKSDDLDAMEPGATGMWEKLKKKHPEAVSKTKSGYVMKKIENKKSQDKKVMSFADGGMAGMPPIPEGFQLEGQQASGVSGEVPPIPPGFELESEKYGSLGQQAKAGLEGAAEGIAGPLAPAAERFLGVKPEDILGRKRENPITQGVGQAVGLGASMFTGVGEGAIMAKVGQGAAKAAGLAEGTSLGFKIGSAAVSSAAEMAFLQGSDEASKAIIKDPDSSAQHAIANVGLSTALGGVMGAGIGAVSPLWKATAGPKVEQLLTGLKNHLNGGAKEILPEAVNGAVTTLGIDVPPAIRAGLSGDPKLVNSFNVLKETQHPEILAGIEKLKTDSSNSVMKSLGITPEDVLVSSNNEEGHAVLDAFKNEYKTKYEPFDAKYAAQRELSSTISVPDEARLAKYGQIVERGMNELGTDSPYYKLYEEYGNRLLAKDTIGGMDKLNTEINNRIKGLKIGGDQNTVNALSDIKSMIKDFQESEITKQASTLEKAGVTGAKDLGLQTIEERAQLNKEYANFSKMSDELTTHLGVGEFRGAKGVSNKLTDRVSAEDVLKKFSIRDNADFIPFLQKNFPDTLNAVKQSELRQLIKPSILSAKGENPIDIDKLSKIVDKAMAGKKEYVESLLSPEALQKITAAQTVAGAIPGPKSSNTAGWISKITQQMPASALAGVAIMTGHNPISGYLGGEMAQRLGRQAPDAIRLAYLKFMGSNAEVKASGFKSMVDYLHNTYTGANRVQDAVKAVFKPEAQVLASHLIPDKADRAKLDKVISEMQKTPNKLQQIDNGDLGHYLGSHQTSMSQATTQAAAYLGQLKPHPYRSGPLDKEVQPTKAELQRYERASNIAQQPSIVMQHVKDGTLQASDIQDLHHLYPAVYQQMQTQMSQELIKAHQKGVTIPYKTRMSISLFLGQPMDSTMSPQSIVAAQMSHQPQGGQTDGQQPQGKSKGSPSKVGKAEKQFQTPNQSAESDRSNRK